MKDEIYIDDHGEFGFEDMAGLLHAFPRFGRRAIASALKSEGYRMKGVVQEAIWRGGPEGAKWPQLNPHTGRISLGHKRNAAGDELKNYNWAWRGAKGSKTRVRSYKKYRHRESTRVNPLMRFKAAVRYRYQEEDNEPSVNIGFINASRRLLALVHKHAEGFDIPVTPRMRRFAFAMGFPLAKSTTRLHAPARPLLPPIMRVERADILKHIRQKYINNITRYMLGRQKSISGTYSPLSSVSDT